MSKGMRLTVAVAGLMLAVLAPTRSAIAAEEVIDDFSEATASPGTLLNNVDLGMENVINDTAMSTVTGKDTGLTGAIGGVRQLDVSIATCDFCPIDNAIVGVIPSSQVLDYSSAAGTDGSFTLIYDADGAGLNQSLAFAEGIRLSFITIDAASYPLDITLTLIEGADTATSMTSNNSGLTSLVLDFPFAAFSNIANVDLTNLTRIEIMVNPNESQAAGDLQLGPITTYGTPPFEPALFCQDGIDNDNNGATDCLDPACIASSEQCQVAPAMSTGMMALLIGVLTLCGCLGVSRLSPPATALSSRHNRPNE